MRKPHTANHPLTKQAPGHRGPAPVPLMVMPSPPWGSHRACDREEHSLAQRAQRGSSQRSTLLPAGDTGRVRLRCDSAILGLATTVFKPRGVSSSEHCFGCAVALFTYLVSLKIHIPISVCSSQPFKRSNTETQGRCRQTGHLCLWGRGRGKAGALMHVPCPRSQLSRGSQSRVWQ